MKRTFLIIPIVFIVCCLFACKDDSVSNLGTAILDRTDYNALAHSHQGVNNDSAIYYAHKNLSVNFADESRYYSYFVLGYVHQQEKQFTKAFDYYLKARDLIPETDNYDNHRVVIFNQLAKISKMHTNYDLAIENYEKALAYASENELPVVYYNLGNAYKSNNQPEKATDAYLKGKEIAHNNNNELLQATIYHQLGLLYSALGDYESARSYYLTIINYPGNQTSAYQRYVGKAYHNLASSYMYEKKYKEAIPIFKKSLTNKKEKDRFITHMDLASCYQQLNDNKNADIHFNKAADLFTQVEPYFENIAVFHKMHVYYRESQQHEKSYASIDRYFEAMEQFNASKEKQINSYSAASLNEKVANHNDWLETANLIRKYRYWIGVLLIIGVFLVVFAFNMIRRTLKLRKEKQILLSTRNQVIETVDQVLIKYFSR